MAPTIWMLFETRVLQFTEEQLGALGQLLLFGRQPRRPLVGALHGVDQNDVDRDDPGIETQGDERARLEIEAVGGRYEEIPGKQAADDGRQRSRATPEQEGRDDDGRGRTSDREIPAEKAASRVQRIHQAMAESSKATP